MMKKRHLDISFREPRNGTRHVRRCNTFANATLACCRFVAIAITMAGVTSARADNFPVPFRKSNGNSAAESRVANDARSPSRGAAVRRSTGANMPSVRDTRDSAERDAAVRPASHTVETSVTSPERPSMPLAPPKNRGGSDGDAAQRSGGRGWFSTMTSLSVVVGAFLLLLYVARRHLPQGTRRLPAEAVESLGRMTLGPRQELHLVRVGTRLLVIGASPQGLAALGAVDEPEEVERLEQLCRPGGSATVSSSLRQALTRFEKEQRSTGTRDESWTSDSRGRSTSRATRRGATAEVEDV